MCRPWPSCVRVLTLKEPDGVVSVCVCVWCRSVCAVLQVLRIQGVQDPGTTEAWLHRVSISLVWSDHFLGVQQLADGSTPRPWQLWFGKCLLSPNVAYLYCGPQFTSFRVGCIWSVVASYWLFLTLVDGAARLLFHKTIIPCVHWTNSIECNNHPRDN